MSRRIVVEFLGKDTTMSKTASAVERQFGKTGAALDKLGMKAGKILAGGLAIGGAALVKFGTDLARIEKINAQTEAVIESTGGAAGVTGKHIEGLAGRIEALTASEAEAVQEGMNLLLTFTNVQNRAGKGNKIFNQATMVMNDMSVAMGTDMKSSAMLVGKALNDPIKGMSALSRAGVQFTEGQKETIKSLVEGGKTMQAQKIIIKELETQFGGSGEAFAKTAQGQLALLQHRFGEIGESITLKLMPAFLKLLDVGMDVLDWVDQNRRLVGILVASVGGLLATLWAVSAAMRAWVVITKIWTGVTKVAIVVQKAFNLAMRMNPIGLVITAIAGLVAGIVWFATKTEVGRKVTAKLWAGLKSLGAWLVSAGTAAWAAIKGGVEAFIGAVARLVNNVKGLPGKIKSAIGNLGTLLWDAGSDLIQGLIDGIQSKIGAMTSKLGEITNMIPKFKGPRSKDKVLLKPAGVAIMEGLIKGIRSKEHDLQRVLGKVTDFVKRQGDKLKSLVSDRNSFASGFRSFSSSMFGADLGLEPNADGNMPTNQGLSALVAHQQEQKAKAQQLARDVNALVKKGLSKDLLRQLQASGESGIEQIRTLAGASSADITRINADNAATNRALQAAGGTAGNAIYGGDIREAQRAQALAKAIRNEMRTLLRETKEGITVQVTLDGRTMVASLKKEKRRRGGAALGIG